MTQNIHDEVRTRILQILRGLVPDLPDDIANRVEVTPTKDPAHGDLASNAAMVAARAAKAKPADLAARLVAGLAGDPIIETAESAGPGFVNLRLTPGTWRDLVPGILRAAESYGDAGIGAGTRINVEYVSANPTGPMHIGHCRGAVVGDALANLLKKAGFSVTKEFYSNDAGAQVAALAWAAYWRYLQALGTTMTQEDFAAQVPMGLQYGGDYLVPIGNELAQTHGSALAGPNLSIADPGLWIDTVRNYTIERMNAGIRDDLAALGVHHDVFTSERALLDSGAVDATLQRLNDAGLLYRGTLEPPKGKLPDDWEPREQLLFRSTQFGDDVDRPLQKSDGSSTYFANDIAYHADKIKRGFDIMIDVWGADHGGYVSRLQSACKALGGRLDVVLCQIVHVLKNGEPVRMSKRAGSYVALRDLIDEVGPDAVRFTMLTRKSDAQMEFDIAAAVAQTRENPVFYVQYAHARCRSVLRAAAEMFGAAAITPENLANTPLDSLENPAELGLIRRLASWPRLIEGAALSREPHRIAFFLYDLAGDFHMLWNLGRDDAALRFLQADRRPETLARVALVAATAGVIWSGLAVMGVRPVEEMR